ncbi:hypothetical protein PVAP13_9NG263000 [Panicum virgatum]|nr:hypothetical protein PVAP13_9NG263000 [Panicum virgatum]
MGGQHHGGIPAQDVPRLAPVVNQPHGLPTGQQSSDAPGGRGSGPHGLPWQAPTLRNLQLPPPPLCPTCNSFPCICHPMRFRGKNPPPAQPISRKAMDWGERMAARTGKLTFRDDSVPASTDLPPPQQHPQPPPPVGAGVQQLQYQPAVGDHPVGQHGEAPGGDAAQLEHPVLPADQPGHGPNDEFDICSGCEERPAAVRPQPRWHVCLCSHCVSLGVKCVVCTYNLPVL